MQAKVVRILGLFILTFGLASPLFSQSKTTTRHNALTNEVLSQVVRRILRTYFKPATSPRTVFITGSFLTRAMLPTIRNTRFVIPRKGADCFHRVYEFTEWDAPGSKRAIAFGRYDPCSGGTGDIWNFRFRGNKLQVWSSGEQWGSSGDDRGP
ncbi:MAG: hypothetical protein ABIO91_04195 [Pyrinomonadaceae bacterium]